MIEGTFEDFLNRTFGISPKSTEYDYATRVKEAVENSLSLLRTYAEDRSVASNKIKQLREENQGLREENQDLRVANEWKETVLWAEALVATAIFGYLLYQNFQETESKK